jgi:lipopolysaccharide export system protein LptC
MKIYSREFEAENSLKRIGAEVYSASEFRLTRYQSNNVVFSLEGKNASQLNDGYLYLSGDIAYKDFLPTGVQRLSAKTPKILAQLVTVKEGRSLLESSMKLHKATLPDEVKILYEGDALSTKNVLVDMDAGMISTQQNVQVEGPDGSLKATGGTFAFRTGDMKFSGPVHGVLQSARLKLKSKSTK